MICVEVHSNNVLTVRNNTFSNAVSDSVKHETVKFLFSDNWKDYQKTAVFSAEGVEPINVLLTTENGLCVAENECYIPFEVLKGERFILSVYGVNGDKRATSTRVTVEVLESGYAVGDKPKEPTKDQYSQIITLMTDTKAIAQSVRDDADAGVFNGERGEQGAKGDTYTLTEADKLEIADMVKIIDMAPAIVNTVSGGNDFIEVTDVSSIPHVCSCRLTSDTYEEIIESTGNIYDFNESNMSVGAFQNDGFSSPVSYVINEDGTITFNGTTDPVISTGIRFNFYGLEQGKTYTFSLRSNQDENFYMAMFAANDWSSMGGEQSGTVITHTFTATDADGHHWADVACCGSIEGVQRQISNLILYPKLEFGVETGIVETVTKPFVEDFSTVKVLVDDKVYIPNADGTVTGIESTSPCMTIITDNREQVKIYDFVYCADTKRYIDNAVANAVYNGGK